MAARRGPRRGSGWPGALALSLAAATSGRGAAAQPLDPIPVLWDAPEACPGAAHVDAAIDELLGGAPPPSTRELRVRGVVEVRDGAFVLTLETEDERGVPGRRTLSAATCEALADAAALVVALGWDPEAVAAARARPSSSAPPGPAPPGPAPPGPADPPPAPAPPALPPPPPFGPGTSLPSRSLAGETSRPAKETPRVSLGLGVLLEVGGLPAASPGLAGWAGLLLGAYRLELGALGIPSSEGTLAGDPDRGGRFGQIAAVASFCRALAPWKGGGAGHELAACLGMEGGATFASGFGVDQERTATVGWAAPRAGALGRLAIAGGVAVRFDVHLAVPLVRDTFVLEALGAIHQPAPVALRLGTGLDLRF